MRVFKKWVRDMIRIIKKNNFGYSVESREDIKVDIGRFVRR